VSKFCTSCGAPIKLGTCFCGECGGQVEGLSAPAGPPPVASSGIGLSDNGASTLAYAFGFITGIVFLVLEPYNRSKTVRFHALHSIFFNATWLVLYVLVTVIVLVVAGLGRAPLAGGVLMMVFNAVLWLGGIALWVLMMVKAYQGQRLKLPIIGRLAVKYADKTPGEPEEAAEAFTLPGAVPPPPPDVAHPEARLGPSDEPVLPPEPPPAAPGESESGSEEEPSKSEDS